MESIGPPGAAAIAILVTTRGPLHIFSASGLRELVGVLPTFQGKKTGQNVPEVLPADNSAEHHALYEGYTAKQWALYAKHKSKVASSVCKQNGHLKLLLTSTPDTKKRDGNMDARCDPFVANDPWVIAQCCPSWRNSKQVRAALASPCDLWQDDAWSKWRRSEPVDGSSLEVVKDSAFCDLVESGGQYKPPFEGLDGNDIVATASEHPPHTEGDGDDVCISLLMGTDEFDPTSAAHGLVLTYIPAKRRDEDDIFSDPGEDASVGDRVGAAGEIVEADIRLNGNQDDNDGAQPNEDGLKSPQADGDLELMTKILKRLEGIADSMPTKSDIRKVTLEGASCSTTSKELFDVTPKSMKESLASRIVLKNATPPKGAAAPKAAAEVPEEEESQLAVDDL
jgi:hypothetical protein